MSIQPFEAGFSILNPAPYLAVCHSCDVVGDISMSPWCDCVTKERTPVCGSCGECRCKRPLAERRELRLRPPQPSSELPQPRVHPRAPLVLLVDDDEEIRLIGAHVIEKLGFRCETAENGPTALAMVAANEPAIVITDALMPKMDGRDLCRFIKNSSRAKVVIMTSLYTSPRYKYEAYRRFGADDYLAKPIDFAALQATLARLTA